MISSPKLGLGFSINPVRSRVWVRSYSLIYARSLFLYYLRLKFRVPAAGSGDTVVMALIHYETSWDRAQNFHVLFSLSRFLQVLS